MFDPIGVGGVLVDFGVVAAVPMQQGYFLAQPWQAQADEYDQDPV